MAAIEPPVIDTDALSARYRAAAVRPVEAGCWSPTSAVASRSRT